MNALLEAYRKKLDAPETATAFLNRGDNARALLIAEGLFLVAKQLDDIECAIREGIPS